MTKESIKSQIARVRSQIVAFQLSGANIRENKKRTMARLTLSVKNATSASMKASYRQSKINELDKFDNSLLMNKRSIDSLRKQITAMRLILSGMK